MLFRIGSKKFWMSLMESWSSLVISPIPLNNSELEITVSSFMAWADFSRFPVVRAIMDSFRVSMNTIICSMDSSPSFARYSFTASACSRIVSTWSGAILDLFFSITYSIRGNAALNTQFGYKPENLYRQGVFHIQSPGRHAGRGITHQAHF